MADHELTKHIMENSPFYLRWANEIAAATGVIILGLLRAIGARELQKREIYATTDTMKECEKGIKDHVTDSLRPILERMDRQDHAIEVLHSRIDHHIERGG